VQEIAAVVAPKLMGGRAARTPLGDLNFSAMDQVPCSAWNQSSPLGDDWLLRLTINV
jgi:diaminohydroxyphosphoribosylaminopyrimidine deaminase/5-amino-6-(5-phosphoribosylamino)uracil reductase